MITCPDMGCISWAGHVGRNTFFRPEHYLNFSTKLCLVLFVLLLMCLGGE